MICELTGMDLANSSMYDGGTALAEAAMLSCGSTKKKKLLVSEAVHPESRDVVKTYANGQSLKWLKSLSTDGVTDIDSIKRDD